MSLRAQQTGDFVLGHLVDGVGTEAVHLGRIDAGIGQRLQRGLHRQPQFGAAGVFGKFGGAQADNGRAPGN